MVQRRMSDAPQSPEARAAAPRAGGISLPPITLALIAILMGCVLDAFIKHLGASYTAVLVACGRYVFGTLASGAVMLAMKRAVPSLRTLRGHAIRAVASTISAVFLFHSLSILPLAEATVILFCAPLMIAPLARWLLGEKFHPMAIAALMLGFIGVLFTIQGAPLDADNGRRLEGVLSGLAAAVLYALSIVLLRQLAQRDDALTTAFLGNVFPALYLIGPAIILGVAPVLADIPSFAMTGIAGFALWFMLTKAYARAPAQRLAATEYTALIWSALLGLVFFQEVPRWQVGAGALVICLAVGLSAWDGVRKPRPVPPLV
jgi:S-adenosylmethionine uptake transporter